MPVPNPPGMVAVPPRATGNRVSMTRCPVTSGRTGSSLPATGRGCRTGQRCSIASGMPSMSATAAVTAAGPGRTAVTVPDTPGGTSTGWP